ncbi:type I secretion system permease/ATPase [Limnohabitans sp.]|uniref:type I secretion system permease/ATPase n=1 Tax=Limnohabitans sp. TaxID=1907725 RepID=UPI0038B80E94
MTDTAQPDSYLQDPELATLLSRLAALQGHSVAAYRFGMVDKTADGLDFASLSRPLRAMELWRMHFPSAVVSEVPVAQLSKGQFPLVWVSQDGTQVLMLRSKLSHGGCSSEDHLGQVAELSLMALEQGSILALHVSSTLDTEQEPGPRTAGEWFVFALSRYRSSFVDAVFATFIVNFIGLLAAMYSMQVYDRVVPSKGYSTLFVLTVGVLISIALELLIKQVRAHMVDRACKAIDQELSAVFFGKALDIRMDARPRTVGTFASQIRHFESVRNFLTSSTLFILADAPFALLFVVIIGLISWQVALVPLVMVPLAIVVGLSFRKPIEKYTAMHMAESNRKNGLLIEAIDGIESIKAANGEWKQLDRWRHLTATIAQGELHMRALSTLSTNITQVMQQITYVGMVTMGAYVITLGDLTMGGLIACTIISGRALSPLAQFPGLIVQWKHAQIALKGLDGIMAMPSDRDPDTRLVVPQSCQGQVRLDKVGFAYSDARAILEVPAMSFAKGERVAILGAVGSGKSTLIKILSGLYKPSTGSVYLDNVDVTQLAPEFVREHLGYLPQDVRLFQGTLRDNLTLGMPTPSDSQILRAASMTGLNQVIQVHPKGLELEISEGGGGLSGGQRQLVGLTRMLLLQPRIMLLDEPTASMDAQLEHSVMHHLFNELPTESLLVVVTHKPALLAHVNRIIVLDKGRVVLDGPRDQVLARLRPSAASQADALPAAQAEVTS